MESRRVRPGPADQAALLKEILAELRDIKLLTLAHTPDHILRRFRIIKEAIEAEKGE